MNLDDTTLRGRGDTPIGALSSVGVQSFHSEIKGYFARLSDI